jgi:hypothetical protein
MSRGQSAKAEIRLINPAGLLIGRTTIKIVANESSTRCGTSTKLNERIIARFLRSAQSARAATVVLPGIIPKSGKDGRPEKLRLLSPPELFGRPRFRLDKFSIEVLE